MKASLSDDNKKTLDQGLKSRAIGLKQKQRAKIILMTAAGLATAELMAKLHVRNPPLNLWRNRYVECGVAGLVNGKSRAPGTALARNDFIAGLGTTKGQIMVQVNLTASTSLHSVAEFENLVIKQQDGAIIRLKDVAHVTLAAPINQ